MIQIICGEKGKGKTKEMLSRANEAVKQAEGAIIFIDKSSKNMYELNNQIRLINITEYPIHTSDGFVGFISGLLSGNHDIECIYCDSLLKVAHIEESEVTQLIETLEALNADATFVLSISIAEDNLPEAIKDKVIVSC